MFQLKGSRVRIWVWVHPTGLSDVSVFPRRYGAGTKYGDFRDVDMLDEVQRAVLLGSLPPSVRTDVHDLFRALVPDVAWAVEQLTGIAR